MADRITIRDGLDPIRQAAAIWPILFPEPGIYTLAKSDEWAGLDEDEGATFDEWFLHELEGQAKWRITDLREATWNALDNMLEQAGVLRPSEVEFGALHRALTDTTEVAIARVCGLRVSKDVAAHVAELGFEAGDVLDLPLISYRLGQMYEKLQSHKPVPWEDLRKLAESRPMAEAEREAVTLLRNEAGIGLRPIFERSADLWVSERQVAPIEPELGPLREILGTGKERNKGVRQMARELSNSQRARGIIRDAERVVATEVAEASNRGAWSVDSRGWTDDTLLIRQTSSRACIGCVLLFKLPNGMPRPYSMAEVLEGEARGYNRGPIEGWHVRIGPIHPNCRCPGWTPWYPGSEVIFAPRAPEYAELQRKWAERRRRSKRADNGTMGGDTAQAGEGRGGEG